MDNEIQVPINSDRDVVAARQKGRSLATALGFSSGDATLIATAISELARNIVTYAQSGEIRLTVINGSTRQGIQLLGMMTEAMHTPLLQDRYEALKCADYVYRAARGIDEEFTVREDGKIANRARFVFGKALELLEECKAEGMVAAIGKGRFGDVKRSETGGKGLEGVLEKGPDYFNPFLEILEA